MCKMQADTTQITALTQELKIMIHIGKHPNIVNLMGAYTDNVGKGELWILVEYCQHGNLLQFLHFHRHNFENVIDPITDLVILSGRDGGESISPLSPVLKSPGSVKSSSDPQSQCEILLESPASPKVLYSSSIFRSGNSLTNRMKMEQNPSYQMAPAANEAALENGNHLSCKAMKIFISRLTDVPLHACM
ncbi:vascular endothelial growth factor receptor 1-like [Macrobrachium nipponense]|uniref:vascular endothelial growth factor receptor 1-like n=1 Tax=Macrobrachium nipponense TaxID=159736 RepID=UPI0030C84255